MKNITLSKIEYDQLKKQAENYRILASQIFTSAIKDPIKEVVADFKKTNLYTAEFLNDLEKGLKKSSY